MPTDVSQLQPAWLDPQLPRAGRYVLGPLLGQGGMGEVRQAWDTVLQRLVALKVLKAMDPVSLIRFMREAQLQARVAHPNICRIYDVESADGAPRIAMQLVRGQPLSEAAPQLTIEAIIRLFTLVAQAMHAAHQLKLIHRDLKPSNILLEPDVEGVLTPYVCDFGMAMILDEPALTCNHQSIRGTPAYMAPEQIRGERHLVGPASDVYALGGALFHALYGTLPPGAALDPEVIMGKRNRPLILPPCPKGPLPQGLETILRKCLEPDPQLRFASMALLSEELWRLHEGIPILTRPLGTLERHLPFLRPRRKTATLLTALGAVLLGLTLGLAQSQVNQGQARRTEWARWFALEAADLDRELQAERQLPLHDLRPAYARLDRSLEGIRARMKALGPDAEGPGRYALGHARYLRRDYAGALLELEQAWASGNRSPEVAYLLARTLMVTEAHQESLFRHQTGLPSPARASTAQRVALLFQQGPSKIGQAEDFDRALLAFSQRDYGRAAAAAHAAAVTHPSHGEAAAIEALSLQALGRQQYEAGDLAGAERQARQAMAAAERFLTLGPGDEEVHHAYLLAGRDLVCLQGLQGTLAVETLAGLQRHASQALRLNPGDQRLQEDWLTLSNLKALREADLGLDPAPELARTKAFLQSQVQPALTPDLRANRMLLHFQLARRQFARGGDPAPELAEALQDAGHTPWLQRDFLGELLNFKAEVEASRGVAPGPTLEATLARFQPILQSGPAWSLCETIAETWLLRAAWETAHGLDAATALQTAKTLLAQALQTHPGSASAYALEGLAWCLEAQANPEHRSLLIQMAREQLTASLAHGPALRLQRQLTHQVLKGRRNRLELQ